METGSIVKPSRNGCNASVIGSSKISGMSSICAHQSLPIFVDIYNMSIGAGAGAGAGVRICVSIGTGVDSIVVGMQRCRLNSTLTKSIAIPYPYFLLIPFQSYPFLFPVHSFLSEYQY